MNFNLDVRLKQLESLEHYISSSRDKVQSILDCLKWDINEVTKESQLIKCSIDPSHKVPLKSVDEHVKNCSLRREDYELNEDFLSEPLHDLNSSIVIDDHKKIELLSAAHKNIPDFKSGWNGQDPDPKTSNRLLCTFSPDERSALHSYAVTHTVGPPVLPEFNTMQPAKSGDKALTYEELRMQERDAKRRRIKYKSVHTNRKSHTEVLREVIDGQMDLYVDWLGDNGLVESKLSECHSTNEPSVKTDYDQNCDEQHKSRHSSVNDFCERSQSVISRNSTHSSSSRSATVRNHHKSRHEYNHHRRYDDNNYKNYDKHDRGSRNRRRSREHHDRRKHRRSRSRHSDRYDESKIR